MSHEQSGAQSRLVGSGWTPAVAKGWSDTVVGHQNNVHGIKHQGLRLRLREEAPAHSKAWLKELHFSGFSGRK